MNSTNLTPDEIKYQQALKRVKRIKGFYTHLMVYVVVNLGILIANYKNLDANENFWRWQTFSTVLFWGIGLFGHALSVFLPTVFLNKDWEERKIKELMEKEKQNKWE
ncbi:2TM domain-containing protein [Flavobacterium paronense]|uniref:2TM domain-containing protein n=1 Tax=Flavobacterium paronense TaxID=1392775 RepID=A0ABV5GB41_9FLAO|nr:2TM domain-containing protein [Flavobacterium paronense]MDN3676816.1 2TM domain-containing protein [Flavobacterium paronense]